MTRYDPDNLFLLYTALSEEDVFAWLDDHHGSLHRYLMGRGMLEGGDSNVLNTDFADDDCGNERMYDDDDDDDDDDHMQSDISEHPDTQPASSELMTKFMLEVSVALMCRYNVD